MNTRFIINAEPTGKARHRSMILNGRIHTYNTRKNTSYEKLVQEEYQKQANGIYFTQDLEVVIEAYFRIPTSWSKKKKQEAIDRLIKPEVKPDCDNISKIILDSLNGVAYKDDKIVTALHTYKYYSSTPRVVVTMKGRTENEREKCDV